MKVKNVLNGLKAYYELEELNIIAGDQVIFSGKVEAFENPKEIIKEYQSKVSNFEVVSKTVFNFTKAFLFVKAE